MNIIEPHWDLRSFAFSCSDLLLFSPFLLHFPNAALGRSRSLKCSTADSETELRRCSGTFPEETEIKVCSPSR